MIYSRSFLGGGGRGEIIILKKKPEEQAITKVFVIGHQVFGYFNLCGYRA